MDPPPLATPPFTFRDTPHRPPRPPPSNPCDSSLKCSPPSCLCLLPPFIQSTLLRSAQSPARSQLCPPRPVAAPEGVTCISDASPHSPTATGKGRRSPLHSVVRLGKKRRKKKTGFRLESSVLQQCIKIASERRGNNAGNILQRREVEAR